MAMRDKTEEGMTQLSRGIAQCPPAVYCSQGNPLCKSVLGRQRKSGLCLVKRAGYIAAHLRQPSSEDTSKRQSKWVRKPTRHHHPILHAGRCLIRVSQKP